MKRTSVFVAATIAIGLGLMLVTGGSLAEDAKKESSAKPDEQIGIEGTFVRIATNDEGWVVLGYRIANESVGETWMLLDVGITVMGHDSDQTISRDAVKLVTPDLKVLSMPTQEDFEKVEGKILPLVKRSSMVGDSINYFPSQANHACSLNFFSDPVARRRFPAADEVELTANRGCLGRLYFEIPGGIQYGNYNLDVVFKNSVLKVPMEIMTEERAKEFTKEWKEARKKQ